MSKEIDSLTRSYFIGFGLSLVLTITAFLVAKQQIESEGTAYALLPLSIGLVVCAVVQLIVQLLFFFHLGHETKPRLNLVSFLFMMMVVGIIGFGSLWIMYNLNYSMMPREVESYIQKEENIIPASQKHRNH